MKKDGVSRKGHNGQRAYLDEESRMACGYVPEQLLRDRPRVRTPSLIPA
jgi:hypothetical protein